MSLTSNGLFNPMNRFGYTKTQLLAYSCDYRDRSKVDFYIPTRNDVFSMPIQELQPILVRWFTAAPETLVPTEKQKRTVVSLLKQRKDRDQISGQIQDVEGLI
jgi:hypothetical protein